MADTIKLANVPQHGDQSALPLVAPSADINQGEEVNVIAPWGAAGTVPTKDLDAALAAGYQLETPDATHQRVLQRKYGDSPITAGALGVARGATFGLSDLALRGLGAQEATAALERYNPISSTIGEVGGAIGAAFIPGLGFAGDLGHATEEATAGSSAIHMFAEGGKFAKVAARYAPVLAKGATEGALYGAGGGLSQAALSSDPITAEALLGDMATGALLGAGTGAAMAAGGKFLSDSVNWAKSKYASHVIEATAPEPYAPIGDPAQPQELRPTEVPPGWKRSGHTQDMEVVRGMPTHADLDPKSPERLYVVTARELEEAGVYAPPGAVGDKRMPDIAKITGEGALNGKKIEYPPMELHMDPEGKMYVADGRHRITTFLESDPDRPMLARFDRMSQDAATYEPDVVRLGRGEGGRVMETGIPKPEPVADHVVEDFKTKYHYQDTISRKQFRQFEGGVKRGKIVETPELKSAIMEAEDARVKVRSFLPIEGAEDGSRTYEQILDGKELGGSYAKGQGKSIASWTADNAAIAEAAQQSGFREAVAEHQAAIDRVQSLLGNNEYPPIIGNDHPIFGAPKPSGGSPVSSAAADVNARANGIRDMLGMEHKPPIPPMPKAPPVGALVEAAHGGLQGSAKVAANSLLSRAGTLASSNLIGLATGGGLALSTANPLNKYLKDHGVDSPFLRSVIAGTVGVIATSKIRGALNPLREVLFGKAGGSIAKLASGVDSIVAGKGSGVARKVATGILGGASFAMGQAKEKPKGTVFQQRAQELSVVAGNPMQARVKVHDQLAGIRAVDPMLSDQMEELAMARLAFLHAKMPKDPGAGALLGKRKPWEPTDSEVSKWARYVDAAEHPEHVLHSVADGTVTQEQVETLIALYPTTYERIRSDIANRAAELQATLPWDKRLTLSVLFHMPTDDILQPQNVAAMQNTFAEMAAQKQENAPSPMVGQVKPPSPTRAQNLASHP